MEQCKIVEPSQKNSVALVFHFVHAANGPPDLEAHATLSDRGSWMKYNLIKLFGFSFAWVFMN